MMSMVSVDYKRIILSVLSLTLSGCGAGATQNTPPSQMSAKDSNRGAPSKSVPEGAKGSGEAQEGRPAGDVSGGDGEAQAAPKVGEMIMGAGAGMQPCAPGSFVIQSAPAAFEEGFKVRAGTDLADEAPRLKSGDIVTLCPGRHEVSRTVLIKGLHHVTIQGTQKSEVVATGDFSVFDIEDSVAIRLSNLRVVHEVGDWCAQNCVDVSDSKDVQIHQCELDGSGYYGLTIMNSESVEVTHSKIHNCTWGVWAAGSKGIRLTDNWISGNRQGNFEVPVTAPQFINDVLKDNHIK